MVIVDESVPADIVDRLLWRDAQQMLGRHAGPDPDGNCVWCGWRWPCAPRRLAERADAASRTAVAGGLDAAARPEQHPGDAGIAGRLGTTATAAAAPTRLRAAAGRTPNRGYFD